MSYKYPTREKLKHKTQIDLLFAKGKWHSSGNLRIISIDLEKKPQPDFDISNVKIGVSVSKKYFKKAVDRNRIKRLLREAYRHNKDVFAERFGAKSLSMLFWVSKEKPADYHSVNTEFLALCQPKK